MCTETQKIHRFHSPAMFLNVNTFWQSLLFLSVEGNAPCFVYKLPRIVCDCYDYYLFLFRVVFYFCCFFLLDLSRVSTGDFQFALFTLVNFLFVHTYHDTFTNINNNNTYELIFVLSRLGLCFVSFRFLFFSNPFEIVK